MVILVAPTDTSKAMGCTLGSSSLEIQRQWIIQVIISFHMVPEEYNSKAVADSHLEQFIAGKGLTSRYHLEYPT